MTTAAEIDSRSSSCNGLRLRSCGSWFHFDGQRFRLLLREQLNPSTPPINAGAFLRNCTAPQKRKLAIDEVCNVYLVWHTRKAHCSFAVVKISLDPIFSLCFCRHMLTYLGRAVVALCEARHTTAQAIARYAGMSHATLGRACQGRRLEERTLRALCTQQPDTRDGLDLLLAHLRDEIDRAGRRSSEIQIEIDGRIQEPDIRLLEQEAARDPQLAALLVRIAALCRARPITYFENGEDHGLRVAED